MKVFFSVLAIGISFDRQQPFCIRDEIELTIRAGKSTQLVYLSKSTSNSEKSYSSTSNSTQKKLYLKYK